MKLYTVVHNKKELCTVQSRADAELLQLLLGSLGLVTRIRACGAAYRVWPAQASPPLLSILDQASSDLERTGVIAQVLLNKRDAMIYLFERLSQAYKRLVQLQ